MFLITLLVVAACALFLFAFSSVFGGVGSGTHHLDGDKDNACEIRLRQYNKVSLDLRGCATASHSKWERIITETASTLQKLDLGENQWTDVPFDLSRFVNVHTLFLSGNRLTEVPPAIAKMPKLTRLSLKNNKLTWIDPQRQFSFWIVHLILTENSIADVRSSVCHMQNLRKFMMAGNSLDSAQYLNLFGQGCELSSLELIRFTRNQIHAPIASSFLRTIGLSPKLSWVSFSGNPVTRVKPRFPLTDFASDVSCESAPVLGEGTSGVVRLCRYQKNIPVAVKFFKAISSDGSATDEMLALENLPPGRPELLRPLGKLPGAVVFPFLNGSTVAKAPNIETVTADIYDRESCPELRASDVVNILNRTAWALDALHAAGIAHGDVYAHNVFLDVTRQEVFLTDFGASFVYTSFLSPLGGLVRRGNVFETAEVRAWCVLARDLEKWSQFPSVTAGWSDICGVEGKSRARSFAEVLVRLS